MEIGLVTAVSHLHLLFVIFSNTFDLYQSFKVMNKGQEHLSIPIFKGGHVILDVVVSSSICSVDCQIKHNLRMLVS
jgi:hypothetical protein